MHRKLHCLLYVDPYIYISYRLLMLRIVLIGRCIYIIIILYYCVNCDLSNTPPYMHAAGVFISLPIYVAHQQVGVCACI